MSPSGVFRVPALTMNSKAMSAMRPSPASFAGERQKTPASFGAALFMTRPIVLKR